MPHVVIEEALDLGLACQGIELAAVRDGKTNLQEFLK
jgi:tmRNA-binding protein